MTGPSEHIHHSQGEDAPSLPDIDPDFQLGFSDAAMLTALGVDSEHLDRAVDRMYESVEGLSSEELKSLMKELITQRLGPDFIAELQANYVDQWGIISGQAEQLSHTPEIQIKINELEQTVKQIPVWRETTRSLLDIIRESGDKDMMAKAEAALEPVLPNTEPIEQQGHPIKKIIGQIATTATRIVKPQSSHKKTAA
jgi:hypothetical protein